MLNMSDSINENCGCEADHEEAKPVMAEYIATTRALHLWLHGAHNVTRGAGFAGDHVHLYGTMYSQIQGDIDGLIEKYPSPARLSALAIATSAKSLVKAYVQFLEHTKEELRRLGILTLGLEDYIGSAANQYEDFVYLLQQREKSELQN